MSKEKQMFGPQHFPIGTVFEVYLPQIMQEPAVYETSGVFKNGPRSYVVQTTHYDKEIGIYKSFNTSHIKRILKRGKGTATIDKDSQAHLLRPVRDCKNVRLTNIKKKHYCSVGWHEMVAASLPADMLKSEMLIDYPKLKDALIKSGALKTQQVKDEYYDHIYTGNKKQMKKVARRVLTKCLLNHRKEEEKENAKWESTFE